LGDPQLGREKSAQAGELEILARTERRQRALARRGLQANESKHKHGQQATGGPSEEATPAHQKACPMLT
jgi:hypothetical protein